MLPLKIGWASAPRAMARTIVRRIISRIWRSRARRTARRSVCEEKLDGRPPHAPVPHPIQQVNQDRHRQQRGQPQELRMQEIHRRVPPDALNLR